MLHDKRVFARAHRGPAALRNNRGFFVVSRQSGCDWFILASFDGRYVLGTRLPFGIAPDMGGNVEQRRYVLGSLFGDKPQILLDHVPHCRELKMVALYARPGEFALKIPYDSTLVGDPARGVVFGGVITTLLDHAGGVAVMCALEEARGVATIDLRIDYMRPATPGRDLLGFARCYRLTRNIAFVTGAAYHDDPEDPFARFQSNYMLGATPIANMERVAEWAGQEGGPRGEGGDGTP